MEGTFFVNSASLFMLSSILANTNLKKDASIEVTTVDMPSGLIEGTETIIFFYLFILFTDYLVFFFFREF